MPLSKIAVGIDFSPESERAVAHAVALARLTGASLTLVHVAEAPPLASGVPGDPAFAMLREQLAADSLRVTQLRDRLAGEGVAISEILVDGDPHTMVADTATRLGADLIAVGTHGRTGARRVLLGSVAERTVRLAESSVLVARGDAVPGGYRRIVVGTDYSPLAWRALERAFEVTAPGGDVRVVHAWRAPYLEYDLTGRMLDKLWENAEIEAAEHRARLLAMPRPAGVTVRLDVVDGAPFTALDDLSGSADLVVVGSHGRRGVKRLLLGSVAEATVRHASCSVLVAR